MRWWRASVRRTRLRNRGWVCGLDGDRRECRRNGEHRQDGTEPRPSPSSAPPISAKYSADEYALRAANSRADMMNKIFASESMAGQPKEQ
jgi:hypothetical protein